MRDRAFACADRTEAMINLINLFRNGNIPSYGICLYFHSHSFPHNEEDIYALQLHYSDESNRTRSGKSTQRENRLTAD